MKTLTLKNIPDDVDYALRGMAKKRHVSVDEMAVEAFRASLPILSKNKRDLSMVFGGWSEADAKEFEHKLLVFEQVDEELWKQ